MQATHDLLYLSSNSDNDGSNTGSERRLSRFDHHTFPGVVPRTFTGALIVSGMAAPLVWIMETVELVASDRTAIHAQLAARWCLGLLVCIAIDRLGTSLNAATGKPGASPLFSLLCGTQGHLMFYASRMLPNTFATVFVIFAFSLVLRKRYIPALAILGATAAVFRSDVLVLIAPLVLLLLASRQLNFFAGLFTGIFSVAMALTLTVPVDSFFWRYTVWPEGAVFWFNTAMNKSSEWGTHPWAWYFYSALPKLLGVTLPFLPYAWIRSGKMVRLTTATAFLFLVLYSFLPHKELRFVLMALPLLFLPIAAWFAGMKGRTPVAMFSLCLLGNLALATMLVVASRDNYPGAVALSRVHEIGSTMSSRNVNVYLDAYAGMTGITRFLKKRSSNRQKWNYNKDPVLFNRTAGVYTAPSSTPFDFLIVRHEDKDWHIKKGHYEWVEDVESFSALDYRRLRIQMNTFLSIFRPKKNSAS